MSFDFNDALKKGADAAQEVVKSRREISEVFDSLEKSLVEYYELPFNLYQEDEYTKPSNESSALESLVAGAAIPRFGGMPSIPKRELTGKKYLKITIEHDLFESSITLCKLNESDNGYPVTIYLEKNSLKCFSQVDLIDAISDLMSSAQTSIKINSLLSEYRQ